MFAFIKRNKSDVKLFEQNPDLQYLLREKKKKTCLPALQIFPMLGETNNQFYLALQKKTRDLLVYFIPEIVLH